MRKNKYIKPYLDNFFLLSYSDLFRVSMDPRVKPEGDGKKCVPEGDGRGMVSEGVGKECALEGYGKKCVPKGDGLNDVNSMLSGIFLQSRKIGMISLFCLFSNTVHAECTPTPDCTELGYTASSCEGGFVRCPFDISKLYCVPCDSSYQYTCSDSGQVGNGESCNGKYIECKCADGYELVDGACVVSCAYTLTALPTGCSAVADTCVKNGTTYYSSTCTSCKTGYTINSGSCNANTCSGYGTSRTGCSNYSTCLSGTTTKYKCTSCNSGYNLSSGQCSANTCSNSIYSTFKTGCSDYTTCTDPYGPSYHCTACESGYIYYDDQYYPPECIDEYCYNKLKEEHPTWDPPLQSNAGCSWMAFECTSPTTGIVYKQGPECEL